jgi:hypothetical protein
MSPSRNILTICQYLYEWLRYENLYKFDPDTSPSVKAMEIAKLTSSGVARGGGQGIGSRHHRRGRQKLIRRRKLMGRQAPHSA